MICTGSFVSIKRLNIISQLEKCPDINNAGVFLIALDKPLTNIFLLSIILILWDTGNSAKVLPILSHCFDAKLFISSLDFSGKAIISPVRTILCLFVIGPIILKIIAPNPDTKLNGSRPKNRLTISYINASSLQMICVFNFIIN